MKKMLCLLVGLFVVASLHAEVSDTLLKGLVDRKVGIQTSDGGEMMGILSSYDAQQIFLIGADGKVLSVARDDIKDIHVLQTPEKAPQTRQEADRPVAAFGVLIDPLGFLQMGPVVELEIRVLPSTLIGLTVRFEGMGLVYQAVASRGFTNSVSPLSMAAGVTVYQLLPGGGTNRVYLGGFLGYGWGSSTGGKGSSAWTGNFNQIEVGAGGGYRWRFPSGFFLDVGALAGLGSNSGTKWYRNNNPSLINTDDAFITFIGMLQLHIGWELVRPEK